MSKNLSIVVNSLLDVFTEFGEEIFNTSDLSKQSSLKDEFVDVNLQLIKILTRKKKVGLSFY